MAISIGTSHTPSSRETNAAWLLRLREDHGRVAPGAARSVLGGSRAPELLISAAESSGR